jgi:hypothetical protein
MKIRAIKILTSTGLRARRHKKRNAALDTFIAKMLRTDGDRLRLAMSDAYPMMEPEFIEEHVRADLERVFWCAYTAIGSEGLLKGE